MNKKMSKKSKAILIILVWFTLLSPFILLWGMLSIADDESLPSFEELENPKNNLATVIYSADLMELGKYYHENRTHAKYNDISPWLVNSLIATEDERFREHSGIDVRALARVVKGVVTGNSSSGGGSTISQQLSKLLFPREKLNKWGLVKRKFKEWIIATRLEKNYTKNEIISMYFNKFDFLNNAVGINSASKVYFDKLPVNLNIQESAMLVGMAKNPSLFNPLRFPERVLKRREVVLYQLKKNNYLDQNEYDSIRKLPLGLHYNKVDHQLGLAPYFRETLREELKKIFNSKNSKGEYKLLKADSSLYDIYSDGLKIYTTIDSRIQKYAEYAVEEHFKFELQDDFFKNNKRWRNPPFSNDLDKKQISSILLRAVHQSQTYKKYTGIVCSYCERPKKYLSKTKTDITCSYCKHVSKVKTEQEILEIFEKEKPMRIFSWKSPTYEVDTIMSPMDSIKYYKGLLRSGLISINPHNGYIKAWVGGPNFKHFKYDMVKKGRRQVGSTFKPFVYATAIEIGALNPCDQILDIKHCVEIPYNKYHNNFWCPTNAGDGFTGEKMPIPFALANSMNNITASVIKKESMPQKVFNRVAQLGMDTSKFLPVPSMSLGVFDLSVYEITSAIASFANKGIYIEPTFILRIEDSRGNVIYEPEVSAKQIWNESTAQTMIEMMKYVTSGVKHPTLKNKYGRPKIAGTALRIRAKASEKRPYAGIKQPVAGKTGTTQNQSDGWFMGLTPDLVTGVWVGAEDRSVRFRSIQLGMGTNMALPIWAYFTHKINNDKTLNISQGDFEFSGNYKPFDCDEFKQNSWNDNQDDDSDNVW